MADNDVSNNGNGSGRGPGGRFAPGCKPGPGNPMAGHVSAQRAKFFASLKDSDVVQALRVIRRVMKDGKHSDQLAAARELLDRVIGKAVAQDLLERIERLEQAAVEARR